MSTPGRRLVVGFLLFVTVGLSANVPRLWHAHEGGSSDHQHGPKLSVVDTPNHAHDSSGSHSHTQSHSHSHAHSHSHRHNHHSHSHTHQAREVSRLKSTLAASEPGSADIESGRWHSHVSFFGWSLTIWGSEIPEELRSVGAGRSGPLTDRVRDATKPHDAEPDDCEKTTIASLDFDWITTCYSLLTGLALPLSRFHVAQSHLLVDLSALENERLSQTRLQPPAPPPRQPFCWNSFIPEKDVL